MPIKNSPEKRKHREDRRQIDLGPPPGMAERRLRPERRHPVVEHLDFDDHIEAADYPGTPPPPLPDPAY